MPQPDLASADMRQITAQVPISNRKGLHARASAKFVRCVELYDADVTVSRDGQTVGGDSIMGLLMLGASIGSTVELTAIGPQAEEVITALTELINDRFGEEA
jgi:phosphocarrier protein